MLLRLVGVRCIKLRAPKVPTKQCTDLHVTAGQLLPNSLVDATTMRGSRATDAVPNTTKVDFKKTSCTPLSYGGVECQAPAGRVLAAAVPSVAEEVRSAVEL